LRRCGLWTFAVRKRSSVAVRMSTVIDTSVIIDILRGLLAGDKGAPVTFCCVGRQGLEPCPPD
jgi:hypothetical protein